MTRNDLYAAAFQYKKTKLWKKLSETEMFAVRLRSGETGYVSIMGEYGELCALGLYIGDEGFRSYRLVADLGSRIDSEFMFHEVLMQQNCLQMMLVGKDELPPEEADEVRAYAKEHKMRLAGKNSFPQFVKCEPNHIPWKVNSEADMTALCEALEAANLLAEILKEKKPEEIDIFVVSNYSVEVPLFEIRDGKLESAGYAVLPKKSEAPYEQTKAVNEVAVASVKRLEKVGIWEAELIRLPNPVQDDEDGAPYYPAMLLVVDSESGYLLPLMPVKGAEFDAQEMLQAFANEWASLGTGPREIRCRDGRTFALLGDFCKKAKIRCSIYEDEMPALDDCEDSLIEHFGGAIDDLDDEFDDFGDEADADKVIYDIVDMLMEMSPEEVRLLPKPLIDQLESIMASGVLPEEIVDDLREKLRGR